jgi:TonB-linked SusC/RagA family outer membrane protein
MLSLLVMLFFSSTILNGQAKIEGSVFSPEGIPLIGVHITSGNEEVIFLTDENGAFIIPDPGANSSFIFSYTGFIERKINLKPGEKYEIVLEPGILLDELIVSAIGVERIKDSQLSSSTVVDIEALKRSGEVGVIQSLSSKSSGLLITNNSGDPGAGAYIQIRAQNTVLGNGSPLIILDGIPISNMAKVNGFNTVSEAATNTLGGLTEQSRLNDIAASDIESITVHKGASAAALYGSGAANGVIVIKTKQTAFNLKDRFAVDFGMSFGLEQVNREFERQSTFGQGTPSQWLTFDPDQIQWSSFGVWSPTAFGSWGDKISDRSGAGDTHDTSGAFFLSSSGESYYPVIEKNDNSVYLNKNRDQVFKNGLFQDYNVGIRFSDINSSAYIGFTHMDQAGMFRAGSNYGRSSFKLNYSLNLTSKLRFHLHSYFINTRADRVQKGASVNGLYIGYLRTPADFDNEDFEGTYVNAAGEFSSAHRAYRSHLGASVPIYNNPGWTINNQQNPSNVNRFIINPEINYALSPEISLTFRYGRDFYNDVRSTFYPVNSGGDFGAGAYFKDLIHESTSHAILFGEGRHKISNFSLNWILGYSLDEQRYDRNGLSAQGLINESKDIQVFDNAFSANQDAFDYKYLYRKNGAFANISAGFDQDRFLIDASARIERSASLPDKSFFYPSISAGWVFSKYSLVENWLDFGKLRIAYGEIGIEPPLYSNTDIFTFSTAGSEELGDQLDGANYGGTFKRGLVKGNPELKVERVKEWEGGLSIRLLDHRLGIGLDVYNRGINDVILPTELPPSTGYASIFQNSASIRNKGIELELDYYPIINDTWNWNVFMNFTRYRSEVTSLPDVSRYVLDGFFVNSVVTEGSSFGALWGGKWQRDDAGEMILNENGFPTVDPVQGVIGDPNPDWMASLGSVLKYKNLSFSFLMETVQGQDMWAGTKSILYFFGVDSETANISVSDQELKTVSGNIIPANTEFRGNIHDFGGGPVALDVDWYTDLGGGYSPVTEQFIQDASWIRLRECGISYEVPLKHSSLGLQALEIGLLARNPWLYTKMDGIDPDNNLTGASKARGIEYFSNPSSKSFIFSLKARF